MDFKHIKLLGTLNNGRVINMSWRYSTPIYVYTSFKIMKQEHKDMKEGIDKPTFIDGILQNPLSITGRAIRKVSMIKTLSNRMTFIENSSKHQCSLILLCILH